MQISTERSIAVPEPANVQATPEEPVQDVEVESKLLNELFVTFNSFNFFKKIEEAVDEPESPSKDAIVIQGNEKIVILRKMFN